MFHNLLIACRGCACVLRSISNCACFISNSFPSVNQVNSNKKFMQAEKIASRMIFEDRMRGSIDQVSFSISDAICPYLCP